MGRIGVSVKVNDDPDKSLCSFAYSLQDVRVKT